MKIINSSNPAELMKSLKNDTELAATENAHLKDGAAMVNFIRWLKQNIERETITEISAADRLEKFRMEQEGCYDLSFSTIAGYMENGAVIHYSATEETNKTLKPEGFLLVDSGGQYEDGTTDITRTIALGPLTEKMKQHYTAVLRSHIKLAMAAFPPGTTADSLTSLHGGLLRIWDLTITTAPVTASVICSASTKDLIPSVRNRAVIFRFIRVQSPATSREFIWKENTASAWKTKFSA